MKNAKELIQRIYQWMEHRKYKQKFEDANRRRAEVEHQYRVEAIKIKNFESYKICILCGNHFVKSFDSNQTVGDVSNSLSDIISQDLNIPR